MLVKLLHQLWLVDSAQLLSDVVLIELSVLSSEPVGHVLAVGG